MAAKAISVIKLTDTLSLSECKDGFWLYDYTRGMNLAMRAKTATAAFVMAVEYYQRRTSEIENKFKALDNSVQNFISSISEEEN